MARRPYKWIAKSGVKKPGHKGRLHRALGYAQGSHIPTKVLLKHQHDTGHLGHMVRFALNMRKLGRRRAKHARTR
jgi:hypothetical protein